MITYGSIGTFKLISGHVAICTLGGTLSNIPGGKICKYQEGRRVKDEANILGGRDAPNFRQSFLTAGASAGLPPLSGFITYNLTWSHLFLAEGSYQNTFTVETIVKLLRNHIWNLLVFIPFPTIFPATYGEKKEIF